MVGSIPSDNLLMKSLFISGLKGRRHENEFLFQPIVALF